MVVAREPSQQELYLPAPPPEEDPDFALAPLDDSSSSGSGGELILLEDAVCHPSLPGYPYTCRILPLEPGPPSDPSSPLPPVNGSHTLALPSPGPRAPLDASTTLVGLVAGAALVWGAALLYYLRHRVRLAGGPRSPLHRDPQDHLREVRALEDGPLVTDLAAGPGTAPGVFGDLTISEEVGGRVRGGEGWCVCVCVCGGGGGWVGCAVGAPRWLGMAMPVVTTGRHGRAAWIALLPSRVLSLPPFRCWAWAAMAPRCLRAP
jgi:hypothetical protein